MIKKFKKWKKTHRQRKRKRERIVSIEISPETMLKLVDYCKRHKCSIQNAIRKALSEAVREYNESKQIRRDT